MIKYKLWQINWKEKTTQKLKKNHLQTFLFFSVKNPLWHITKRLYRDFFFRLHNKMHFHIIIIIIIIIIKSFNQHDHHWLTLSLSSSAAVKTQLTAAMFGVFKYSIQVLTICFHVLRIKLWSSLEKIWFFCQENYKKKLLRKINVKN